MKLVLRRKGHALHSPDPEWGALMEELPENVDLNVSATKARSLSQLGTYWGLLSFVCEHGPERISSMYPTKDELSDALQLEVGFVRHIKLRGLPPGTTYAVPASKSFAECTQERFNQYFSAVQDVLTKWCGYDPLPEYKAWLEAKRARAA